ncbi:hypothetical protein [Leclercia adecarboxylata]|uniref:hypothetical protein n=1 Tax=Leclercia adecarboxylata TaxID=83655 RepID=UPI0013FDFEED|nr:hypothetical protein [Leclercia adecarboxylata]QIM43324.1 hypothetical protein G7098_11440 [Leclercia adecarboxylata]
MSPFIVSCLVAYAFCAGLVAAKVWRRVNNLNFSLKAKISITGIWAAGCIFSWPILWLMEDSE